MRKRLITGAAAAVLLLLVLTVSSFGLLQIARCPKPDNYIVGRLRGQAVGKSLGMLQYRWLRRHFIAYGATLDLSTEHYEDRPGVGLVPTGRPIATVTVDDKGEFDFGALPADKYSLGVKLPATGFRVVIDPSVRNQTVLIDASPGYYCACCGWDLEVH